MRRIVLSSLVGFAVLSLTLPVLAQGPAAPGPAKAAAEGKAPAPNDNTRVLMMMTRGLSDDIIIAKIKASRWTFQLDDDDILALRKAGLSPAVLAVMVNDGVFSTAMVRIDDRVVPLNTLGKAQVSGRGMDRFDGDLTSVKDRAQLQGPVAAFATTPMPEICVTLPKGDSIDKYVLVEMDKKGEQRDLNMGPGGGESIGKSGIRSGSVKRVRLIRRNDNTFQMLPLKPLANGEYMVYVLGSGDPAKHLYGRGYDFSVSR